MKNLVFIIFSILVLLILVGCPTGKSSTIVYYDITVNSSGELIGESISSNLSRAAEGDIITFTAILNSDRQVAISKPGESSSSVIIENNGGSTEFIMPPYSVEFTALFSDYIPYASENGFNGNMIIGNKATVTISSESLNMIYANDTYGVSFPTETDDSGTSTLSTKFWLAETELTNAVMVEILQWAYNSGKFNNIINDPNGLNIKKAKHGGQLLINFDDENCRINNDGSGLFTTENGYENNPVTNVSWYGAVMICNWLTEMRDGNTDNIVYTGIDINWIDDETIENISRNGYRLPSCDEWEYAARFRGNDLTNTVSGFINPYFTRGNSASNAYTHFNDESDVNPANGVVDNKDANDIVAVYSIYFDGGAVNKGTSDEAAVKSLGSNSSNTLGLYDMSGNVWEWCFTESGSFRIYRGGGWGSLDTGILQVGFWGSYYAYSEYSDIGFRLCRTADL